VRFVGCSFVSVWGTVVIFCASGSEQYCSHKSGNFLNKWATRKLHRNDGAPWS